MNGENFNTVLVVDDQNEQCQALQMILKEKYRVLTCCDPQEALNMVCANKAALDVVLLDIKMPEISGIELLRAIRKVVPDVEAAFITGFPSTQTAIEAMHDGAYDYIIKPFDKTAVLEVVSKGVQRRLQRKLKEKWVIF